MLVRIYVFVVAWIFSAFHFDLIFFNCRTDRKMYDIKVIRIESLENQAGNKYQVLIKKKWIKYKTDAWMTFG